MSLTRAKNHFAVLTAVRQMYRHARTRGGLMELYFKADEEWFDERAPGPRTWRYRTWTNPLWRGKVKRREAGMPYYEVSVNGETIPAGELGVFASKLLQITNGGRS